MTEKENRVCPASQALMLDNCLRRLVQKPAKIVGEFIRPGMNVIDIGCGPGYFTLEMARMIGPSGKVTAVELQPEMLEQWERKARKKGLSDRIKPHRCLKDRLDLPDHDGRFDFALLYYMIHETPDPAGLLTELKPMMKATGKLLVVEPALHVKEALFREMLGQAEAAGYKVEESGRKKGGLCAVLSVG